MAARIIVLSLSKSYRLRQIATVHHRAGRSVLEAVPAPAKGEELIFTFARSILFLIFERARETKQDEFLCVPLFLCFLNNRNPVITIFFYIQVAQPDCVIVQELRLPSRDLYLQSRFFP